VTQLKRIHILHVVYSLDVGGMENGVVNISNRLDPKKFKTTIACIGPRGRLADRLLPDTKVICLEKPNGISIRTASALRSLIARERPSVVHTHNLAPLIYAALARVIAFGRYFPPILHGEHAQLQSWEASGKRRLGRNLLYRFTSKTHSVSTMLTKHLQEIGLPCPDMHSIINGVDSEKFHPAADRKTAKLSVDLPPDSTIIGYSARFAKFKRHTLLLEAFHTIASQIPDARLLFVGDGNDATQQVLDAVAAHPFKDRIHLTGFQQDPSPYYRAMDLHVMVSSHEGLSNAILESMASGVPNLLHPACGAVEVVTDNHDGLVRPLNDAPTVSAAILSALSNMDKLRQLGMNARTTALERFSIDSMINAYAELYRACIPASK